MKAKILSFINIVPELLETVQVDILVNSLARTHFCKNLTSLLHILQRKNAHWIGLDVVRSKVIIIVVDILFYSWVDQIYWRIFL